MNYQQHPLSAAFPAMLDEQFLALKDSIIDIGVQDPITLFEGMVIDGWHRYNAANELGMDCPTVELGDVDPQAFVVAKNKARRHITMSQIATAVVTVYQWKPAHRPKNSAPGADLSKSTKQLAEIAGVGTRTIEQAKTVEAKATPEVKAAVKSGVMSVKKAAETVNPPKAKEESAAPSGAKSSPQEPEVDARDQEIAVLREQLTEAHDDIAVMSKVLDAGDQVAAALTEAKTSRDLARGLQQRVNSMLTEIAELTRTVKFWKKKAGETV